MVSMRVVEVTVDEIVDVVAVRHRFVAAGRAMGVSRLVTAAAMGRGALRRVRAARVEGLFVDMTFVRMMQMPVMQVVDMIAMADGGVTASGTVLMRVSGVGRMRRLSRHHCSPSWLLGPPFCAHTPTPRPVPESVERGG